MCSQSPPVTISALSKRPPMIRLANIALRSTACLAIAMVCAPALAQQPTDYAHTVRAMKACAGIADIPGRVACYDRTIAEPSVATNDRRPAPSRVSTRTAAAFGHESLPQTSEQRSQLANRAELRVTSVEETAPRVYRFVLADGGTWELTDAAPLSYDAPRKGESVAINRASLRSFLMEYSGQASLRIKRVR